MLHSATNTLACAARRALMRVEYLGILALLGPVRVLPWSLVRTLTFALADLTFALLRRRRALAIDNARHALGGEPEALTAIARASFRSFFLTAMPELARLQPMLDSPDARTRIEAIAPELVPFWERVAALHSEANGCVFVTPHLGNWELLPHIAGFLDVPLAVVIRPLDNAHLERLLLGARKGAGQVFVPKSNSLGRLQLLLQRGISVGMLPDQATIRGLPVEFLGRPALTSPIPALLALRQNRPLVVVACLRSGDLRFTGYVGDPIWPSHAADERAEVKRLTVRVNAEMAALILRFPEQYLWMHDRWKSYTARTPAGVF